MNFYAALSLKRKIQFAFALVSILTISAFTALNLREAHSAAIAEVDAKLKAVAMGYVYVVGAEFHDTLKPKSEVSLEASRELSKKITDYQ